jgi:O-antigen ligase
LGAVTKNWLDTSYFADISGRATSLFENPNYLAAYLCVVFPFALYQMVVGKARKERVLSFMCAVFILVCTVLTWSRGAWLAMLISGLVFCLILSKKTVRLLWVVAAALPFAHFVLPKNVITRFMSIGDMADSSTLYRVYTWRGSIELVKDYFWGGIGYGPEAFSQIYPLYAYAGIENSPHSHSLYLQILISMGIAGLVCFAVMVFFYFQKGFEYLKKPASRDGFLITLAALSSTLALLIMGLFDYVWYNYRLFFMFWLVIGICVCCVRIGKREQERCSVMEYSAEYSASIDLQV